MESLEHYLDRVCRGIGGPRSLRQHLRQELREHLLDGIAQHRESGLSQAEALKRTLEVFGQPDDVRSELEATHGHRLIGVIIENALQWKEKTMRAKWLWMSWAYLGLVLVIVPEILTITFAVMFIIPKYHRLTADGIIDQRFIRESSVSWMPGYLHWLQTVTARYTPWLVLTALVAWGIFEWRVRSENKPWMRLAALGTSAVGLMVVLALTFGSLAVSFAGGAPAIGKLARPYAVQQVVQIESANAAMEKALNANDWDETHAQMERMTKAIRNLVDAPSAMPALLARDQTGQVDDFRRRISAAADSLEAAAGAVSDRNATRLTESLERFREDFRPIREAANRAAH